MGKFWCLTFLLLFSISCTTFRQQDEEIARLHLQIGTSHLNSGNYPQALSELLTAESLDSKNPITHNNLGLTYFFRERNDLAEIHLRKAISLKPDYSDARNNLARILIERGRYNEAMREAQIVVEDLTYPYPEKPLLNVGISQFKLNQFEQSRRTFEKAIEFQRDSCLGHTYFGRSLFELRNYRRAAEALDKASSFCQKSEFDEPYYYSALSYYQLGQKQKAEARLEGLLKLFPQGEYAEKAINMLETIRR
jgi:type IV pilus assembly protein PilF